MRSRYRELEENKFHISVANGNKTAMHGHEFLEFSYITTGSLEHEIDGKRTVLRAGDYFIVDYGTKHAYRTTGEGPLQVVNLLFYPEFVERTLAGSHSFEAVVNSYMLRFSYETLPASPTGETFHDTDGKVRQIVEEVMAEYRNRGQGYIEYIRCLFVQMLIITMRKAGMRQKATGISDEIMEISEYVKAHYAQRLRLKDFASRYNYSVSYLSRKFAGQMGMDFSEYLQRIRIEQSCRLLENTSLPVGEVAEAVGYENVKFFNQVFKQIVKLTPREFRRIHR